MFRSFHSRKCQSSPIQLFKLGKSLGSLFFCSLLLLLPELHCSLCRNFLELCTLHENKTAMSQVSRSQEYEDDLSIRQKLQLHISVKIQNNILRQLIKNIFTTVFGKVMMILKNLYQACIYYLYELLTSFMQLLKTVHRYSS